MYIFKYIVNAPNIPEYHNTMQTLCLHDISHAIDAYEKRRNNPMYALLTVEYYYNGSYVDQIPLFNSILNKRGK